MKIEIDNQDSNTFLINVTPQFRNDFALALKEQTLNFLHLDSIHLLFFKYT